MSALTGNCLKEEDSTYYIIVRSGSKGGKYRQAPVIGDVDLVVRKMKEAGNKKVWSKIHDAADIHSYRADYATLPYKVTEANFQRPYEVCKEKRLNTFQSL